MNLTVVTPWLDCPELMQKYWQALEAGLDSDDRAIIIDNGSNPAILASYRDRFATEPPSWATFERWPLNYGFSVACNAGLARVGTEAVLFLNNDVRMNDARWLERIKEKIAPGALVGLQLRSDPHTAVDGLLVPYLDGWCLAGMTEEIRSLGGWDEEYEEPSYYGDNDLCARAVSRGMQLVIAEAGLRHLSNYTSKRMKINEVSAHNRTRYEQRVRDLRASLVNA